MRNIFIKYPKRIIMIRDKWMKSSRPSTEVIRSSFNVELYLDYLNAINTQIK